MRDTLEMMKLVVIGYEKTLSKIELIREYKKSQAPNILAYMFVDNYGILSNISINYKMLSKQDIASYCLQELDKAMFQFDENRQCSFITFFCQCFKNRLRCEQELLMTDIRYANYCVENIDEHLMLEDPSSLLEDFDFTDCSLSKIERRHCRLLLSGYSVKEISEKLNVTVQSIYNRNKKIGKKLLKTL